ncbi:MAG: ankyrin repeat domain-containing protein [Mycobacteriaceae bacterium]|nr:ankyrin repeat domain-containing protein [Mycobacteriaceae bacterium]
MMTQAKLTRGVPVWQGLLDPKFLPTNLVSAGNHLADAAKQGDWPKVFMALEDQQSLRPYQWRLGGKSWFTVLHQAAWHGASENVVDKLIKRGGIRSLRDAKGRIPFDVAQERGHHHLLKRLKPPPPPLSPYHLQELDMGLADLVYGSLCPMSAHNHKVTKPSSSWREMLRYPPVEIMGEFRRQQLCFKMIGNDAVVRVTLNLGFLEVIMWSVETGESGLVHVVTRNDVIPVYGIFA